MHASAQLDYLDMCLGQQQLAGAITIPAPGAGD